MQRAPGIAHQIAIAARLAGRSLRRRLSGSAPAPADDRAFRATLEPWLAALPANLASGHAFHWLSATRPPWHDSGIDLVAGESVTLLRWPRISLAAARHLGRTVLPVVVPRR